MTDTQNELIHWAAEYAGWGWVEASAKGSWDYPGDVRVWQDDYGHDRMPIDDRSDLHALVGLVEDRLRTETATPIQTELAIRQGLQNEWVKEGEPPDYLIARLGALKQLVEKINEHK